MADYEWSDLDPTLKAVSADPWALWALQRFGENTRYQLLCESAEGMTPQAMRAAGWDVPPVYGEDARFFTARKSLTLNAALDLSALTVNGPSVGGSEGL
nr:hypothetical protein [uncultured Roseateles sp.]